MLHRPPYPTPRVQLAMLRHLENHEGNGSEKHINDYEKQGNKSSQHPTSLYGTVTPRRLHPYRIRGTIEVTFVRIGGEVDLQQRIGRALEIAAESSEFDVDSKDQLRGFIDRMVRALTGCSADGGESEEYKKFVRGVNAREEDPDDEDPLEMSFWDTGTAH